jgi:alpha-mannosidase
VRIVRGGDAGDSYNYAPPQDDVLVDEPEEERTETVEEGPLRRVVVLQRAYRWDNRLVATETRFEQRAGEPFVRIRISFDNPCDDQRVRVHVPLPEEADRTYAEGQLAVVERPPLQEGGHGERGLGAYPASAFVSAGGVALLFEHVVEYELVAGRELAVTILRSIGLISRAANPWRRENAGPELPIPAAQMHGPHSFSFAWCPDSGRALEHAERYRHPLLTVKGTGGEGAQESQAGPELGGALLSSLRRRDGSLEARIVNETGAAREFSFGSERGELRPWEIRTLTL